LLFDQPQRITCISLVFEESEIARTQEFVLQWSGDDERPLKEIVRQQWNFTPPETICEAEEYQVELLSVVVLELVIKPHMGGGGARASLKSFRLS
jgi:predicted ATP-grasp superfamily ATP-dependent carboligase